MWLLQSNFSKDANLTKTFWAMFTIVRVVVLKSYVTPWNVFSWRCCYRNVCVNNFYLYDNSWFQRRACRAARTSRGSWSWLSLFSKPQRKTAFSFLFWSKAYFDHMSYTSSAYTQQPDSDYKKSHFSARGHKCVNWLCAWASAAIPVSWVTTFRRSVSKTQKKYLARWGDMKRRIKS